VIAGVALLLLAGAAFAEEGEVDDRAHHVHGHHEASPNHIGLFLGVTAGGETEGHGKESNSATIAVDYERRFTRLLGAGVIVEFVGGERRAWATGAAVTFRPLQRTKFLMGVGWERQEETGHTEPLARIGFSYAFQVVPGNSISPEINLDFVDGETVVVAGVTIGWGF
jgi:hypothetical protein